MKMVKQKFLAEFIYFAIKEIIDNLKNTSGNPSFRVIESIMKKYSISREGAWSLYRPVFWYLSDRRIISKSSKLEELSFHWNLRPEYQNPSEDMLNELTACILHSYGDTLNARLEKLKGKK
jgi:hypothetical protein